MEGFGYNPDPITYTNPCNVFPEVNFPVMNANPYFLQIRASSGNGGSEGITISDISVSDTLICQSSQSFQSNPMTKTQAVKIHYVDAPTVGWLYINGQRVFAPTPTHEQPEYDISHLNIYGTPVPGSPSEFTFWFATTGMSVGSYHAFVTIAGFNSDGIIDTSNSPVCIEIDFEVFLPSPPC